MVMCRKGRGKCKSSLWEENWEPSIVGRTVLKKERKEQRGERGLG
jgi:hypothetical protein